MSGASLTRRTRLCIVSAAPVTDETINFFASYDFPVYGSLLNAKFTKLLLAYGNNKKLLYHQIVHLFKWFIEVRSGRAREA